MSLTPKCPKCQRKMTFRRWPPLVGKKEYGCDLCPYGEPSPNRSNWGNCLSLVCPGCGDNQ